MIEPIDTAIVGYETLQFHTGGLFDGAPTDRRSHLVARTAQGTPGPTLCGIARFARATALGGYVRVAPGWSVGGGFAEVVERCEACALARRVDLPVSGLNSAAFDGAR